MRNTKSGIVEHIPVDAPVLWDAATVARITGKSIVTLSRYRMFGTGPKWVRLGRQIRYRREDVASWIAACSQGGGRTEVA